MRTLQHLKESVEQLIAQQGADAPVAAFIFTNEDVFVFDEDGNPDPMSRDIAEIVLDAIEDQDFIYDQIFHCMEEELSAIV